MIIQILNCNNIDNGDINIAENRLNIKYAMNGTGKSTIARAIELHIKGGDSINELMPFKYIESKTSTEKPSVNGLQGISSVSIFNDDYINQYAFKQDEILTNSFEIFVKTSDYDARIEKIESIITEIKNTFKDSKEIDQVIGDLGILSDSFGKSKSGYSEAGALAKGIGKGNKVANVPKGLESYTAYLKSSVNSKWLRWQMEGNNYSSISDNCPYCTSPTEDKKEIISKISKEYDPKSVEHLNKILGVLDNLCKYFSNDANEKLKQLANNIHGFSKEEISYLVRIKEQIDTLKGKMLDLRGLTFFSMKDAEKVSEFFNSLKINLSYLPELNSENTRIIIQKINDSLDKVLTQVGILQGEINQQNLLIKKTIELNKTEINDFLKYAGYKYHVDVEYAEEKYKMKLKHLDFSQTVANGNQHLSYGEKNAFSLVLFMYECIAKNPDIIILDDPISSFDRNKKYAVIDMLFRGGRSLRGKTVLMMTHDLEPVIDILYNLPRKFDPIPSATYFESKNGLIREIEITKSDISTFGQICDENINKANNEIVKIVYLRRYYEIINNKGMAYQLLSNLLHKRATPFIKESGQEIPMTQSEIDGATSEIKDKMPNFDYILLLAKLTDVEFMKNIYNAANNNYEKLQLFRVIQDHFPESDVINKFINEAFHIENEYIMQVNPCKYEIVPSYIIEECDKLILSN
ncbi:MAG TPA: hypothetical protein PKN50_02855 [Spirochaetota bacterium]|nr:hypothetical protein [Spirochaetota bacterium]HPV42205.1 hypothetical protein [Spirochaetota bacterium]